jgi:tetratricopeptide (TPR) repeat protein
MATNRFPTLSSLLDQTVRPDPDAGVESAADACLMHNQYDAALSGYYQLDASIPRIATKIAYCQWMAGDYDDARNRLFDLKDDLDEDGIGLLCELIVVDSNYKRQKADMEAIWPRLKAVVAADSVPLIAAVARSQGFWPSDGDDREQRLRDVEHLLALHPGNQFIRLAVLRERNILGADAADLYALLKAWPNQSPAPRYLWEAAKVAARAGEPTEARDYLNRLEARERRSAQPSSELLFHIALARCAIALEANLPETMSEFDRLVSDASSDSEHSVMASLAALEAACRVAPERVSALGDHFLEALEARRYGVSIGPWELLNETLPVEGAAWDSSGNSWSCGDLQPLLMRLSNETSGRARLYFRACLAITRINEQSDADVEFADLPTAFWDGLAGILGEIAGSEGEFAGRLLSLHTAIRAHRADPDWADIGSCWIASECAAKQIRYTVTHGELTVDFACGEVESLRRFASGIIDWLKKHPVPVPSAYDMVESVVVELVSKDVRDEFFQLMGIVSPGDDRPTVQFYLGLSAQWMKEDATARTAYQRTLASAPGHYSAIFNSLLLCKAPADAPFLGEIAGFVAQFPENKSEERQKLCSALASARQRCEDVVDAKRRMIREELSRYPALVSGRVELADISLRAAVALLALFRCANAEPGDDDLAPFDASAVPFAPVVGCWQVLFDLLNTGLITVHPKTSSDAFSFRDGEVKAWRFGSVRWQLSPSCDVLVERLRSLNGEIPKSWREQVQSLAFEIARGEMVQYLNSLAEERGWPEPRDTDEVSDLTRALVNELPVAQAFYVAYLGAMSASDYKQKYPVSRQQASDMLVKRTGSRLESVRSGKFPAKEYERPWKLPRSAISLALWGTILDRGDDGFTRRIADLITEI